MGLNPLDKVVILKTTHEAIFSQICAPPQKCGVIGESGKATKGPRKQILLGKSVLLSRKEAGLRGGLEMVFNRQKTPSLSKATLLPVPAGDGDLHGGYNDELKWQREKSRAEIGKIFNAQENAFDRCRDLLFEG